MTNRSSNRTAVPEAKGALDKFKYEVANELGVPLSEGYNGDLTSRQNGSVGGYMVNNIVSQGNMSFSVICAVLKHIIFKWITIIKLQFNIIWRTIYVFKGAKQKMFCPFYQLPLSKKMLIH